MSAFQQIRNAFLYSVDVAMDTDVFLHPSGVCLPNK